MWHSHALPALPVTSLYENRGANAKNQPPYRGVFSDLKATPYNFTCFTIAESPFARACVSDSPSPI
jgi:hypothetical protein